MSGLRFYYDLMSQPSRAVFLFLKASNIPFVGHKVALRKGTMQCIAIDIVASTNSFRYGTGMLAGSNASPINLCHRILFPIAALELMSVKPN